MSGFVRWDARHFININQGEGPMTNKDKDKTEVDDKLFVDALPPRRTPAAFTAGQGLTQRFVRLLETRPGEWAKYPSTLKSQSGAGTYRKEFPEVEWTSRKRDDGRYDVYARWVGVK